MLKFSNFLWNHKMNSMQQQWQNSYLFGANANFIEELYEQYLINPQQLNPAWKNYFDSLQNGITDFNHQTVKTKFINLSQQKNQIINNTVDLRQHKVFNLIHHYRFLGVNCANLDPLQLTIIKRPQELELTYHGLSPNDLEDKFLDDYKTTAHLVKLKDIIARYEAIYCQNIGFEYTYITDQQERKWLIDYIESNCLDYNLSSPEKIHTLIKLTEAETLEKFLATTYVGQKRFSLEGAESLIPALDRIISQSAGMGIEELVIGMSHRGRINALINLAGKSPAKLFAEFEANYEYDDFVSGGDVKYHKGYQCNYRTPQGVVHITIAHNPSHLETVNPVVAGIVRAKQDFSPNPINVLGVLIHGDSALIGLGTNQGYFTSSQTPAYGTLGMIHISVNNQVGFTNSKPSDNRSSRFNTDIVKMIDAPVIHVNGDDLTKVLFAMDMAIAYRQKFNRDIMIDLVCFRRHGHNEADDPSLTQPAMYRKIRSHLGIRKLYGTELSVNKILTATAANQMVEDFRSGLTKGVHWSQDKMSPVSPYQFELAEIKAANWRTKLTTAIDQIQLLALAKIITTIPQDFNPHPTLVKTIEIGRAHV